MAPSQRDPRSASTEGDIVTDCIIEGIHTSAPNDTPAKSRGMTPTTVKARSLSMIERPTTAGSAARRVRQKPSLTTTTARSSGTRSSSGRNVRPRAACAPSIGKKLGDTTSAAMRSTSSPSR